MLVSLTTTPFRHKNIECTLDTLLNQTLRPDAIVVNVAFDSPWLEHACKTRGILLQRLPQDLGPITKLLPALDRVPPDGTIVTVDDDIAYPPTLLAELAAAYDRLHQPVSFSGYNLAQLLDGSITIVQERDTDKPTLIIEGYAGALYPRHAFGPDFTPYVFNALRDVNCRFHDDAVISHYLETHGWRPTFVKGPIVNRMLILRSVLPHGNQPDALFRRGDVVKKTVDALIYLSHHDPKPQ